MIDSVEQLEERLEDALYFADRSLATSIFLALKLNRPLLLEGEPGVGKTEIAKVLTRILDGELIRLQCHEGLDVNSAVYEWDYARQMLQIRLVQAAGEIDIESVRHDLFGPAYLLRRPLLRAVDPGGEALPILLVDELDRADEEFEAFLLEILSEFQVTVPEIGTFKAKRSPVVIITSNRTREIHDALRRRCLYHWIEYPSFAKEYQIVTAKAPEVSDALSRQVVGFVQALRDEDLYKRPGVAETLDWIRALQVLDQRVLTVDAVGTTLGTLLKYQDDIEQVRGDTLDRLLAELARTA